MLLQRRLRVVGAAPVILVALHRRRARLLLRHDDVVERCRVAQCGLRWLGVLFEKRIGGERLLHFLRELQRGHLEKLQRLLDLRRKREMLPQP